MDKISAESLTQLLSACNDQWPVEGLARHSITLNPHGYLELTLMLPDGSYGFKGTRWQTIGLEPGDLEKGIALVPEIKELLDKKYKDTSLLYDPQRL